VAQVMRLRFAAVLFALLYGCASNGVDPLEGFNRKVYTFNDGVDRVLLRPVATGYTKVTPEPVRNSVHRFFVNLGYPTVVVNQFLQGKPRLGLRDLARFVTNTTLGIGGLMDVARRFGLERHEEDFGQTLAVWGVGSGPFLVVPFWGPVTLRDGAGDIAGIFTYPTYYVKSDAARWSLYGMRVIDVRAQLLELDDLITGDRYIFTREAYLQRRQFLIEDGEGEDPFLDDLE
jgi:phospholipid-binding lipoprotein MlaA